MSGFVANELSAFCVDLPRSWIGRRQADNLQPLIRSNSGVRASAPAASKPCHRVAHRVAHLVLRDEAEQLAREAQVRGP